MSTKRTERLDPRDEPNYGVTEASRWLDVRPSRLRTWLCGQTYTTQQGRRRAAPVVTPASRDPLELSFWNLVECSVLATIRTRHDVSLQRVRKALDFVGKRLGKRRPLIEQDFSTDGVSLFVERYGELVDATADGQSAMREVLAASLTRIDRDAAGLAMRLFPWRRSPNEPRLVAVDPQIAFGRPVLVSTRVPIDVVLERFQAGDSIAHLADEYSVEPALIEDLVRNWFGASAA